MIAENNDSAYLMSSQRKAGSQKRKIVDEGSLDEYCFIKTNNTALYLIHKEIITVLKGYNLTALRQKRAKYLAYQVIFYKDKIRELEKSRSSLQILFF